MTRGDVPLGMRLKDLAGWNQTEADWLRLLDLQPNGCFVAELDGAPVGTTATCSFGPVAWIAMVLVDPPARGRGVGTALLRHALERLEGRGARTVRLDATPLGRPLYEKLGFRAEYELARFEGSPRASGAPSGTRPARPGDVEAMAQLDRAATGTDRAKLIARLFAEGPASAHVVESREQLLGFSIIRPGSRALQIGPCIAAPDAGAVLLGDALRSAAGTLAFVDIPLRHDAAVRVVEAAGLTVQRRLLRMSLGEPVLELPDRLWAGSGPEKG